MQQMMMGLVAVGVAAVAVAVLVGVATGGVESAVPGIVGVASGPVDVDGVVVVSETEHPASSTIPSSRPARHTLGKRRWRRVHGMMALPFWCTPSDLQTFAHRPSRKLRACLGAILPAGSSTYNEMRHSFARFPARGDDVEGVSERPGPPLQMRIACAVRRRQQHEPCHPV
jgi:hypothetical protein